MPRPAAAGAAARTTRPRFEKSSRRIFTTADGETACGLLTAAFVESFTDEGGEAARAACANLAAETFAAEPDLFPEPEDLAFGSIEVDNDAATVVVFVPDSGGGRRVLLRQIEGEWLIDDIQQQPSAAPAETGFVDTGSYVDTGF